MALNPTKEKDVSNLIGKESADPSNQSVNGLPTNINQNIVPPNSNLENFMTFLQTPGNTTTIPVSSLKTTETPIKVPPQKTTPTTNILGQSVDSALAGFTTDTETQANKNKLTEGLNKIISNIESQGSKIADITAQEGLTAKDTARRKATADLTAIDKAYLDEVAKIKENREGKFGGAIEQDIQKATDAYNNRRANSVIVANYALGDYQAALDTVNLKVNSLKDQNAQSIQAYQLLSNSVMNDLTESEKLQVQANLQQKKDQANLINNAYSQALEAASQNQAPSYILDAIDEAANKPDATAADIYKALGKYGQDTLKQLQIAKAQVDLKNAQNTGTGTAITTDYSSFLQSRTPEQVAAFNAIPEADRSSVAQLVSGDALLTDLVKSRGIQGTQAIQKLINEAVSVDPTFSVNTNKIRYEFLKNFNNPNGKSSVMRNSINTALGHLADFKTSADSLDSGSLRKLNTINNILTTETGDPKVLQLRADISALASELGTVYKNGVSPTEKEIENWERVIAADFSKNQFQGVSDEISKLLTSKITATRYQYKQTMGFEYAQPIIDPDKRQALVDAGINPDVIATEKVPGQVSTTDFLNNPLPGSSTGTSTGNFWDNLK